MILNIIEWRRRIYTIDPNYSIGDVQPNSKSFGNKALLLLGVGGGEKFLKLVQMIKSSTLVYQYFSQKRQM